MKRFQFRLERVLHYLHQQEMLQSMEVAKAERVRAKLVEERDLHELRKLELSDIIRREHTSLSHEELGRLYAHGDYLHRAIGLIDGEIIQAQIQIDAQRELLLKMSKKRKIVEELRERRRDIHEEEVLRLEIAGLDEVNDRRRALAAPMHEDRS